MEQNSLEHNQSLTPEALTQQLVQQKKLFFQIESAKRKTDRPGTRNHYDRFTQRETISKYLQDPSLARVVFQTCLQSDPLEHPDAVANRTLLLLDLSKNQKTLPIESRGIAITGLLELIQQRQHYVQQQPDTTRATRDAYEQHLIQNTNELISALSTMPPHESSPATAVTLLSHVQESLERVPTTFSSRTKKFALGTVTEIVTQQMAKQYYSGTQHPFPIREFTVDTSTSDAPPTVTEQLHGSGIALLHNTSFVNENPFWSKLPDTSRPETTETETAFAYAAFNTSDPRYQDAQRIIRKQLYDWPPAEAVRFLIDLAIEDHVKNFSPDQEPNNVEEYNAHVKKAANSLNPEVVRMLQDYLADVFNGEVGPAIQAGIKHYHKPQQVYDKQLEAHVQNLQRKRFVQRTRMLNNDIIQHRLIELLNEKQLKPELLLPTVELSPEKKQHLERLVVAMIADYQDTGVALKRLEYTDKRYPDFKIDIKPITDQPGKIRVFIENTRVGTVLEFDYFATNELDTKSSLSEEQQEIQQNIAALVIATIHDSLPRTRLSIGVSSESKTPRPNPRPRTNLSPTEPKDPHSTDRVRSIHKGIVVLIEPVKPMSPTEARQAIQTTNVDVENSSDDETAGTIDTKLTKLPHWRHLQPEILHQARTVTVDTFLQQTPFCTLDTTAKTALRKAVSGEESHLRSLHLIFEDLQKQHIIPASIEWMEAIEQCAQAAENDYNSALRRYLYPDLPDQLAIPADQIKETLAQYPKAGPAPDLAGITTRRETAIAEGYQVSHRRDPLQTLVSATPYSSVASWKKGRAEITHDGLRYTFLRGTSAVDSVQRILFKV